MDTRDLDPDVLALAQATTPRYGCRICDAPLIPVLDLGAQYLSDFPLVPGDPAHPPLPLEMVRCSGPTCGLVQLAHTTPKEWLYGEYWYRSGVNEAMRAELLDVVVGGVRELARSGLGPGNLLVGDIGANDGTLLSHYPKVLGRPKGLTRIAWEPAHNLYAACRPHAELVFPEFFRVREPWPEKVHLLSMVACFYDVDQPHQLVGDVAKLLHQDGVWVIQQAYLPKMLEVGDFTNICHEHLEYYHLQSMRELLAAHGLEVFHVEARAINGGSFRAYVGWRGRHPVDPSVLAMQEAEMPLVCAPDHVWEGFARQAHRTKSYLQAAVSAFAEVGGVVDLLGASTKGNTLLQFCGLDRAFAGGVLRQVWERSPEKHGRYYGQSGLPIVSEEVGRATKPKAGGLLLVIWPFRDSVITRERAYLETGSVLIVPLPQAEVHHFGGLNWKGLEGRT